MGGGGGEHLQKETILYRVWRNDRLYGLTKSLGSGGILPRNVLNFSTPMPAIPYIF